jgi:hypothetical protein
MFIYNKKIQQFDLIPKYNFYVDFTDLLVSFGPEVIKEMGISSSMSNPRYSDIEIDFIKIIAEFPTILKDFDFINTSLIVRSANLPGLSLSYNEFNTGPKKTAGNVGSVITDDLVIDFYKEDRNLANTLYYNWISLAINLENGTKRPRDFYEKTISIYIFNRYGKPVEFSKYFGCIPKDLTKDKLDVTERNFIDDGSMTLVVNNGMDRTFF